MDETKPSARDLSTGDDISRSDKTEYQGRDDQGYGKDVLTLVRDGSIAVEFKGLSDDLEPGDVIEYKEVPVTLESGGDLPENCFKLRAAVFSTVDRTGDVIAPGAFKNAIPEFLAKGFISFNHQWRDGKAPIGKPTAAYEDDKGLVVEGKISETAEGKDVLTLMRDGVITKASIGYQAKTARYLSETEGKALLGEAEYKSAVSKLRGGKKIRHLIEINPLLEASPVTIPAHPNADVLGVKSDEATPAVTQTLDDHTETLLAEVKSWTERMTDLSDLRFKEGRVLSGANVQRLQAAHDVLTEHLALITDMIAKAKKESPENKAAELEAETKAALVADFRREQARFLKAEAARIGVFA
jgi:HK97 family phage prohead protease